MAVCFAVAAICWGHHQLGSVYVGSRDYGYGSATGLTQAERDGYLSFLGSTAIRSRTPMLYVGANDGMLHGFRVANGVETLAYIPVSLLGI